MAFSAIKNNKSCIHGPVSAFLILHSWAGIGVFNKIEKIKKIKKFFVVWKISIFGANVLLPGFGMHRADVF